MLEKVDLICFYPCTSVTLSTLVECMNGFKSVICCLVCAFFLCCFNSKTRNRNQKVSGLQRVLQPKLSARPTAKTNTGKRR